MEKQKTLSGGLLLGGTHFLVDFCCTAILTCLSLQVSGETLLICAIVYNGLAFAFQLPLGALADLLRLSRGFCAFGCLLVAIAPFLPAPILVSALLGLGNACFHVGGGREALHRGGKKAGFVGHFVAPGAIGIFLGPLCAKLSWPIHIIAPVSLSLCAFLFLLTHNDGKRAEALQFPAQPLGAGQLATMMTCMFLTVLLRAYMGTIIHYDFQAFPLLSALFVLCIFGGKFFGGTLADRFGAFPFSLCAQLSATVLFVLSLWVPWCAYPAIFLFNTTMAITAHKLYVAVPSWAGTMFGLTTLALFLGSVPKLIGMESPFFTGWGLLLLGLLSTALLLTGLHMGREAKDA
ncbi:MAG: hypothetical protein IJB35_02675 [Oscillospiraceae bacterium]|nr:hypothetical protein [Oscillospiraceae bacterium]